MVVFDSDLPKQYFAFCRDFGPTNLAVFVRFCASLSARFDAIDPSSQCIIFRSSGDPRIRTNAAFLLAAFLVVEHHLSPEEAAAPFLALRPFPFRGFRDAAAGPPTLELSLLDCLRGLARGMACGWFDVHNFNLHDYEHWDQPDNGHLHRVCPHLIIFDGPVDTVHSNLDGHSGCHSPQHYLAAFQAHGVRTVVRVREAGEKAWYNTQGFTDHGLEHCEMHVEDGAAPGPWDLEAWTRLLDRAQGPVAVHGRAGSGLSGTLAAVSLMRQHGFSAREAMAWLRLCRPGSVIGLHQLFLLHLEVTGTLRGHNHPLAPGPSHGHSQAANQVSRRFPTPAACGSASGSFRSRDRITCALIRLPVAPAAGNI